jgi:hypothetical protein
MDNKNGHKLMGLERIELIKYLALLNNLVRK